MKKYVITIEIESDYIPSDVMDLITDRIDPIEALNDLEDDEVKAFDYKSISVDWHSEGRLQST